MKKFFTLFLIFILQQIFAQSNQDCGCDYIHNYYQFVYEAQVKYFEKKYDDAYVLLKKAEKNCPLLNQTGIRETEMLAEISAMKGKKEDAVFYVKKLMMEEGRKFKKFKNDSIYSSLNNYGKWEKLENNADKIYKDWYSQLNLDLRKEIVQMNEEDQRVRTNKVSEEDFKKVDSINQNKVKEILQKYGYPTPKLIGNWSLDQKIADLSTFPMHLRDYSYFKPLFLKMVKCGQVPADFYANMIDRQRLALNQKFVYGVYWNAKEEEIEDLENLDKSRVEAGLRTWEMEKKYREFVNKE